MLPPGFELLSTAPNASISANRSAGIAFITGHAGARLAGGTPISFALNYLDAGDTATLRFRTRLLPERRPEPICRISSACWTTAAARMTAPYSQTWAAVRCPAPRPAASKYEAGHGLSHNQQDGGERAERTRWQEQDASSRATIGELITMKYC